MPRVCLSLTMGPPFYMMQQGIHSSQYCETGFFTLKKSIFPAPLLELNPGPLAYKHMCFQCSTWKPWNLVDTCNISLTLANIWKHFWHCSHMWWIKNIFVTTKMWGWYWSTISWEHFYSHEQMGPIQVPCKPPYETPFFWPIWAVHFCQWAWAWTI